MADPQPLMSLLAENSGETSRDSYSTLAQLFATVIKSPQQPEPPQVIDVDVDETSDETSDEETEETEKDTGTKISNALEEWKTTMKMSVAVTGSPGVGKSLLINTLLEATCKDNYDLENSHDDEEASDGMTDIDRSDGYQRTTAYSFDGSSEDEELWYTSSKKKSVKPYNKYTAYSFESSDESCNNRNSSSKVYFSIDDYVGGKWSSGGICASVHIEDRGDADTDAMECSEDGGEEPSSKSSFSAMSDVDEELITSVALRKSRRKTYKRATVYIFNHEDLSTKPRVPRISSTSDVGVIDKCFEPDAQFFRSINWQKERNLVNAFARWPMTNQIEIDDSTPFLLPQGLYGYGPQCILLRYSDIPELIVSFPKEGELRLALWELHDVARGVKRATSAEHLRALQARYRRLLGLSEQDDVPLQDVECPQDLPLASDVLALLGKNFRFVGLGRSLEQDRIYIREKLREVITHYGHHMIRIMLRLPSKLLEGNRELVEISSLYASDPSTRMLVQNSNLVMVAIDRSEGLTPDVAALLDSSGVSQKIIAFPEAHKAVFVELVERHKISIPTIDQLRKAANLITSPTDISTSEPTSSALNHNSDFAAFKERLTRQWRHVLLQSVMRAQQKQQGGNSISLLDAHRVELIVRDMSVLSVKPILFTALHLRDGFPLDELFRGIVSSNEANMIVRRLLTHTGIPSLICSVPNRLLVRIARALKPLSDRAIKSKADNVEAANQIAAIKQSNNQKSQLAVAARQKVLEQHMAALAMQLSQRKRELRDSVQRLQQLLQLLAARRIAAAGQAQQLALNAIACGNGTIAVQNIKQHIVKPLCDEVAACWRQIIDSLQLPSRMDMLLGLVQAIIHECTAMIELSIQRTLSHHAQISQLQETVKTAPDLMLKHLTAFSEALHSEPTVLVKEATIKALQQHVTMTTTGQVANVVDFPNFPNKAIGLVIAKFGQLVQSAIRHLDSLQSELLASVRTVLFASRTPLSLLGGSVAPVTNHSTSPVIVPIARNNSQQIQSIHEQVKQFNSFNVMSALAETIAKAQESPILVHYQHGSSRVSNVNDPVAATQETSHGAESSATSSTRTPNPSHGVTSLYTGHHDADIAVGAASLFDKTLWERLPEEERHQLTESFENLMTKIGMELVIVHDDANSQFRALSHQLYGSEDAYAIVRLLVVSEILNHPGLYEQYIALRGIDVQEYVAVMSLEECRGDHLTLAAFANAFGADLLVYSPAHRHPLLVQSRTRGVNGLTTSRTFSIAIMPNDTYASVVARDPSRPATRRRVRHKPRSGAPRSASASSDDTAMDIAEALNNDLKLDSVHRSKRKIPGSTTLDPKKPSKRMKTNSEKPAGTSTTSSRLYKTSCPSLVHLCIQKVVDNIECYPQLEGLLPEELLHDILAALTAQRRLTDSTVARILAPSMTSLTLEGPAPHITDLTLMGISAKCPRLRSLKLINLSNITTNGVVQVVSNCPQLEVLSLQGCLGVGDIAIQEAARKCSSLCYLDLSGLSQITNVSLQEICLACPSLHTLILQHCNQLTDSAFAYLSTQFYPLYYTSDIDLNTHPAANMRVLDLTGCDNLTNQTLETIAAKSKFIHTLKISARSHNITDSAIESIAINCGPSLRVFEITNSDSITDHALQVLLWHCVNLTSLSVAFCRNITDSAFTVPAHSTTNSHWLPEHLQTINLTMCLNVGSPAVKEIARQCTQLQQVFLGYSGELSAEAVQALAYHSGETLHTLDLSKSTNVTDAALVYVAEHCPNLQKVVLRNCQQLTNTSLIAITKHCSRSLKELDVTACVLLTDIALEAIAANARRLEALAISDCPKVTAAGLRLLACCTRLERLRVAGSKALTDQVLLELANGCPALVELDAAYCNNVSIAAIQIALASWPRLARFNLRGYSAVQGVPQAHPVPQAVQEDAQHPAGAAPPQPAVGDAMHIDQMHADAHAIPPAHQSTGVQPLLIQHEYLLELNLSWCKHVDDTTLAHIAEGCPNLVTLDVAWCTRITAGGVQRLVQRCPSLRTLILRGCTGVGMLYLSGASVVIYR